MISARKKLALQELFGFEVHDLNPLQRRRLYQDGVFVTPEGEEATAEIWDLVFERNGIDGVILGKTLTVRGPRGAELFVIRGDTDYTGIYILTLLQDGRPKARFWCPDDVTMEWN